MKSITILGATGSIGRQTLDIIARHSEDFNVFALTANTHVDAMLKLCAEFKPHYAVMADENAAPQLQAALASHGLSTTVLAGQRGLIQVASDSQVDTVMAAIVGASGLLPTIEAARAGKTILLANKESLVMSGQIFLDAVREGCATLLPVDSEHNAVMQCLQGPREAIHDIILTASGGPFLNTPKQAWADITPAMACAHPTWAMGRKISVDSATLMNKGLEVIEACYLFNLPPEQVRVVIHPQSIMHAMVRYRDGSILTHMGPHDMRVAISYTLGYPERIDSGVAQLDPTVSPLTLNCLPLTPGDFPCFDLCMQALQMGPSAIIALNAANEVAVEAFLNEACGFLDIQRVITQTLTLPVRPIHTLDDVLAQDALARKTAKDAVLLFHKDVELHV